MESGLNVSKYFLGLSSGIKALGSVPVASWSFALIMLRLNTLLVEGLLVTFRSGFKICRIRFVMYK